MNAAFGAVLMDLDGVIRWWDPDIIADAERRHRLPAGALRSAALEDHDLLTQAVTGRISDAQWRSTISERLRAKYGEGARAAVRDWSAPAGHVDQDALAVVRSLRRSTRVALFSNATSRLDDDLSRLGLHQEFDHVLNSSALGSAKPDPRAFHAAAARMAVPPTQCVFVDDTPGNVAAARDVGMTSHHFTGVPALRSFLADHGLLDSPWSTT